MTTKPLLREEADRAIRRAAWAIREVERAAANSTPERPQYDELPEVANKEDWLEMPRGLFFPGHRRALRVLVSAKTEKVLLQVIDPESSTLTQLWFEDLEAVASLILDLDNAVELLDVPRSGRVPRKGFVTDIADGLRAGVRA